MKLFKLAQQKIYKYDTSMQMRRQMERETQRQEELRKLHQKDSDMIILERVELIKTIDDVRSVLLIFSYIFVNKH